MILLAAAAIWFVLRHASLFVSSEVKGKLPMEIAVSVAAEVIATYNARFGLEGEERRVTSEPVAKLMPVSRRSQVS